MLLSYKNFHAGLNTSGNTPVSHLVRPGRDVLLKCPAFEPDVLVVWKKGGENGRVLSVGKMLVRVDGKGEKLETRTMI